jgi:hypothetical protein
MTALALALLLTAVPTDAERAPGPRDFRVGAGAATFREVDGVAATAEVGLEVAPWQPLGLRFTFGSSMRVGWGTVFFSPELVYRLLPRGGVSPYLTGGLQAAVLNITDGARSVPDVAEARAAATGTPVSPEAGAGAGPAPLRFSAGPQAGLGVTLPLLGTTLDVGLRYNLHFWDGDAYSGLGLLLTVVGPVSF